MREGLKQEKGRSTGSSILDSHLEAIPNESAHLLTQATNLQPQHLLSNEPTGALELN